VARKEPESISGVPGSSGNRSGRLQQRLQFFDLAPGAEFFARADERL